MIIYHQPIFWHFYNCFLTSAGTMQIDLAGLYCPMYSFSLFFFWNIGSVFEHVVLSPRTASIES